MIIDGLDFQLMSVKDEHYRVVRNNTLLGYVRFKLRFVEIECEEKLIDRHGRSTKGAVKTPERAHELRNAAVTVTEYWFARDLEKIHNTITNRKEELYVPW